jgi:hypothetical protein
MTTQYAETIAWMAVSVLILFGFLALYFGLLLALIAITEHRLEGDAERQSREKVS